MLENTDLMRVIKNNNKMLKNRVEIYCYNKYNVKVSLIILNYQDRNSKFLL